MAVKKHDQNTYFEGGTYLSLLGSYLWAIPVGKKRVKNTI
jgi:hypothetical protein